MTTVGTAWRPADSRDYLPAPVVLLLVEVDTALSRKNQVANGSAGRAHVRREHDGGRDERPSLLCLVHEDVRTHGTWTFLCMVSSVTR
ncbi:hypothetical protein FHG89_15950 [Micromonospora orduensis]|uniref:Uncharacterized protein n=1 Tax=Micromonospora orduensis TaxID=1420891 RepID=A0A5C4QM88_9ACTN|nr:hypothetical protein [Micromonospora orduensis]TNH28192.1 hypothetical protein FHG89_15950 [Micromonospora orduensis]